MSCRQLQRNSRIRLDARFAVKSGTRSKAGSAELTEQPAVPQRFLLPQLYKQANRPAAVEQAAERGVHNFTACRINHAGVLLYAAALRLRYA
jgi:hypothetical protein